MENNQSLAEVVRAHRAQQRMSMREFAEALNGSLINTGVTYQSVRNWETERILEPRIDFLFECIATYDDWRAVFAADCLRAMYPDLIGTKITLAVPMLSTGG